MKSASFLALATLLFTLPTFARMGTTSAGGLRMLEHHIECQTLGDEDTAIRAVIDMDRTTWFYDVSVTEPSLFAPIDFHKVERTQETEWLVSFKTQGLTVLIDTATGTGHLPLIYASKLQVDALNGGEELAAVCEVAYP